MDHPVAAPGRPCGHGPPPVRLTEDPYDDDDPETILEAESLNRFLLQFTLKEASGIAPFNAWTYVMPAERLEPL
ncbi:hypothetical protein [Streptomyces hydrogenans]